MEEAEALASRAAIISTYLLSIGTTRFLRQLYGNFYHVHIMLKSAPTSTITEIEAVERWITGACIGARLNPFGNYHGQVKFSVPASSGNQDSQERAQNLTESSRHKNNDEIQVVSTEKLNTTGTARTLFALLEDNKDVMGIAHYSIAATTLEEVFVNILRENNKSHE
jgi:ATP-binding cassette, subfamily A (ABC1), member 3